METGTSSESKQRQGLGEASGNSARATPPPSKLGEAVVGPSGKENTSAAAGPAAAASARNGGAAESGAAESGDTRDASAAERGDTTEAGGAGLETLAAEEVGQRLPSTQELVSMSGAARAAHWKSLEYAQPDGGGDGSGGATTTSESTDLIDATAAAEATTGSTETSTVAEMTIRPAAAAPSAQATTAADVPATSAPASTHVAAEAGSIRWCLRTLSAMQERDKAKRKNAGTAKGEKGANGEKGAKGEKGKKGNTTTNDGGNDGDDGDDDETVAEVESILLQLESAVDRDPVEATRAARRMVPHIVERGLASAQATGVAMRLLRLFIEIGAVAPTFNALLAGATRRRRRGAGGWSRIPPLCIQSCRWAVETFGVPQLRQAVRKAAGAGTAGKAGAAGAGVRGDAGKSGKPGTGQEASVGSVGSVGSMGSLRVMEHLPLLLASKDAAGVRREALKLAAAMYLWMGCDETLFPIGSIHPEARLEELRVAFKKAKGRGGGGTGGAPPVRQQLRGGIGEGAGGAVGVAGAAGAAVVSGGVNANGVKAGTGEAVVVGREDVGEEAKEEEGGAAAAATPVVPDAAAAPVIPAAQADTTTGNGTTTCQANVPVAPAAVASLLGPSIVAVTTTATAAVTRSGSREVLRVQQCVAEVRESGTGEQEKEVAGHADGARGNQLGSSDEAKASRAVGNTLEVGGGEGGSLQ